MLCIPTIKTDVQPAIIGKELFEKGMTPFGFNLSVDPDGNYISEITQSAWIGYSLCANHSTFNLLPASSFADNDEETRHFDDGENILNTNAEISSDETQPTSPKANLAEINLNLLFSGKKETPAPLPAASSVSHEEEHEVALFRVSMRNTSDKKDYSLKKDADRDARLMCDEQCKPFWVYKKDNFYQISSHGFDLSKRPDVSPNQAAIELLQLKDNFPTFDASLEVEPSIVARVGFNGRWFHQQGMIISTDNVMEWMSVHTSPAVFISIPEDAADGRQEILRVFMRDFVDVYKKSCSYRWVAHDTVLLATDPDNSGYYPAKRKLQNPYFILKAFNRPSSPIMGK